MNILEQLFWMAESCMGVRFTHLRGMAIVEHRHFTRCCSDAFEVQWDV